MDEKYKKFVDGRVEMIKAGFCHRYTARKKFVAEKEEEIIELIKMLLQSERLERILTLCALGQAPLKAVVYDVEKFAEKHGKVKDGNLSEEWKQNVGMLIGTIVYFMGYASDGDKPTDKEDLSKLPKPPKYFHYAATFHKEENRILETMN